MSGIKLYVIISSGAQGFGHLTFLCFYTCFHFCVFHTTAHVAFSKAHSLLLQVNTEFLHKIPDTPNTAYFISHATVFISS